MGTLLDFVQSQWVSTELQDSFEVIQDFLLECLVENIEKLPNQFKARTAIEDN